jgi:hypothetical protein
MHAFVTTAVQRRRQLVLPILLCAWTRLEDYAGQRGNVLRHFSSVLKRMRSRFFVQGVDHGFSQVALKGSHGDASVVWNLPVDVTFKSTNPQGWPRLVVSVYCQDLFGRYVVRGYGSTLVPTVPGRYVRYIRCFSPVASTMLQNFLGWLTGSSPEVGLTSARELMCGF